MITFVVLLGVPNIQTALILNAALVWAFDLYHILSLLSDIHVENDKYADCDWTPLLTNCS